MNFDELYQKAEKNARRHERKVREVDKELEKKRRLQMERIAIERERTKMELKRKMPPPPISISKGQKETQKFVIPKKNNAIPVQTDKSILLVKKQQNSSIAKQNYPRQIQGVNRESHINNKIINGRVEKKQQRDQIQITKKHSIQHKQNSGGQQRQPNYQELLKQAAKNDSSAVEQLFNEVDPTKIVPAKKPRIVAEEFGITAGLRLTNSAAREKEKEALAAETKTKQLNQQQKSINVSSSKQSIEKNPLQLSKPTISNNQSALKRPAENSRNLQKIMTKNEAIKKLNGAVIFDKNASKSKMKISFPSKKKEPDENPSKMSKTNNKNISLPTPNSSIKSSLPQKRYLPGDIRYKGGGQEQQKQNSSGTMKKSSTPKNAPNMKEKSTTNSAMIIATKKSVQSTGQMKQEKMKILPISTDAKKKQLEIKRKEEVRNLTPKQGNTMASKPRMMNPVEIRAKMERTRPPSEYNLARIKKESYDHLQMLKQRDRRPFKSSRPSGGSIGSRKFANYSETDEDEEEEEEEDEYGDEDDSDLADFIDDSMVDDLQREDFEETLRIINPRYNKEKWLQRERLIDERRMDARFKDVEMEERTSAKMGLVEDLIEAKRGSKALS